MAVALSGVAGLALAIGLLFYSGLPAVLRLLALAGWPLAWIVPAHLAPVALDAVGWRALLRGERRAGLGVLVWVASIRDSINALLPVARVGGELAAVRLLMLRGVSGTRAGASVIVEVTITLFTQFLFALIGLGILLVTLRDGATVRLVLAGLLTAVPVIVLFVLVQQRWGLAQLVERVLAAVAGRAVLAAAGDPARLDAAVRELYRRRRDLVRCAAWQLAGLLAGAGELWLTLYLLGHPPTVAAALAIESLTQAVLSASFFVPAGLGTQEGSFLLLGAATGVAPSVALALALARRGRQLGFGLPSLLSWQWVEGRRVGRRLARGPEPGA
ncbi:MAG TPA: lysylphosphatidylglycerol synthase domain-containing protein [Gemmatimonadales bacterium]|nr:lysylphosphatidylglycerol synthase domain-containing protein [Gemmatimonadales bacterium]